MCNVLIFLLSTSFIPQRVSAIVGICPPVVGELVSVGSPGASATGGAGDRSRLVRSARRGRCACGRAARRVRRRRAVGASGVECERGLFPAPGPDPPDRSSAGHAATSILLRADRQGCASDVERRPHLVLAFNAGLCAYESWLEALRYCYVNISFASNIIVVVYSFLLRVSYHEVECPVVRIPDYFNTERTHSVLLYRLHERPVRAGICCLQICWGSRCQALGSLFTVQWGAAESFTFSCPTVSPRTRRKGGFWELTHTALDIWCQFVTSLNESCFILLILYFIFISL